MTPKEEKNIQLEDKLIQSLVLKGNVIQQALEEQGINLVHIQKAQWNNITNALDGTTIINVTFVVYDKRQDEEEQ